MSALFDTKAELRGWANMAEAWARNEDKSPDERRVYELEAHCFRKALDSLNFWVRMEEK